MLTRLRTHLDDGFTLIEVMVATVVLVVVMAATAPAFFGAMRITNVTGERSQATNLAVLASEQMRSLPYTEVGYATTPASCANPASLGVSGLGSTAAPVVLTSAGPLDSLPATTVEGHTTFTVLRCVYWSASSIPGSTGAYKQTVVKVSWPTTGGVVSVSQVSALYPGTNTTPTTTPAPTTTLPAQQQVVLPVCTAVDDTASPSSAIDLSWTAPVGGTAPDHYLVYYSTYSPGGAISTGVNPFSTSPSVSGLSWVATVGPGATYYFQVVAVAADGTASSPSNTCSATTTSPTPPSTTTYHSASSATALSLALGGSTTAYTVSSPATSASNNGTGSNNATVAQPTVAIPGADSFLSANAATQVAEANTDGTSYACAGVLSNGATLSGGSSSGPCSISGGTAGGVSLNLAALPGVGTAINTVVGGLTLNLSGASAWATGSAGGSTLTGSASLNGATVTVSTVGGLVSQTLSLSLPATITSQTDVVHAITVAISGSSNSVIKALATPLQTALAPVLSLTGDYQSSSGGVLSVSALHISVLSGAGKGDLALATVGANTSTTVTTSLACNVSSIVVTPSTGTNGGGVALTTSGHLADENSFQLAVSANSTCTNVQVAYAPSDCVPGASGCATSYASLSGTGGIYYGSAGTSSTVWNVGTTTFTVYVGSPAAAYSPLAQQQVILCTQKGNSGKC
ncbi:MAG TPA: fibronectin type III domain-containing protein [Acidimicrobiales bacterium]|nr:fibronectin type III domain-containing protein [Acidimicrobiales bacterium]